jgi:hypothetical protein
VQAGTLRVILKPFRLDAFLATVREALGD